MLAKSRRLTKSLFKRVIDEGYTQNTQFALVKSIKIAGESRFAVSVSKKVSKNATDRNKIRRRAYSVIREFIQDERVKDGVYGVFMMKPSVKVLKHKDLAEQIEAFFVKSGFLK